MTAEAWWLILLGAAFIVVVAVVAGQVRVNRRAEQERLAEAHRQVVARVQSPAKAPLLGVVQPVPEVETVTTTGHCFKCKMMREFVGVVGVNTKGSRVARGLCPVCGTKVVRFLPKNPQPD